MNLSWTFRMKAVPVGAELWVTSAVSFGRNPLLFLFLYVLGRLDQRMGLIALLIHLNFVVGL